MQKEQFGVPGSVETCHAVRLFVQQESVPAGGFRGTEFQDQGAAYGRQERSEETLADEGQQQKDQENRQNVAKSQVQMDCLKTLQENYP